MLGITQRWLIAGHPQHCGHEEQSNQTIKTALHKVVSQQGKDWDSKLPLILMVIRRTPAVYGISPHYIMSGREMRFPEHWWPEDPPDEMQPRILMDEWFQNLVKSIAIIYKDLAVILKAKIKKMIKRT